MIDVLPELGRWVQPLYDLANTPFDPSPFRTACEAIAAFDKATSDYDQWRFLVYPDFPLLVAVESVPTGGEKPSGWPAYRPVRVQCAVLSVCWWEPPLAAQSRTEGSYQEERTQFDRLYGAALDQAARTVGGPLLQGADADGQGHRWALWRGRTGLFVVQQSAYDPQFGFDINYWVTAWSGPVPRPSSPFIDWLMPLPERES